MIVTSIALMIAFFALCFAEIEAENEHERLMAGQRPGWDKHLLQRLVCGVAPVLGVVMFFHAAGRPIWGSSIPILVIEAAVFSLVMRRRLNSLRSLDKNYIDPSTAYGRLMIWLGARRLPDRLYHGINYHAEPDQEYVNDIHDAGRYASRLELITASMCLFILIVTNQ
jgi:hypothetical protein